MLASVLVPLALVAVEPGRLLSDPTDIRGITRGVRAFAFDPAAMSALDGFELGYRGRLTEPGSDAQNGLYAAVPLGEGAFAVGYEWLDVGERFRRTSLGVGLLLPYGLRAGLAYRDVRRRAGGRAGAWDASLLAAPSPWVSFGIGVEQANAPRLGGEPFPRRWRAGVGLRPLAGVPWLTLGAEARLRVELSERLFSESRLLVDVAPVAGLHARVGYTPDEDRLWFGIAIGLTALEVTAAAGGEFEQSHTQVRDRSFGVTWRATPAESLLPETRRTVEVALAGDLREDADLLTAASPVSELPLLLERLADDPDVERVILEIGELDIGTALVEELRAAIQGLRGAGKEVVAELAGGTEKEYLVAAAADRVRLDPAGTLVLDGYAVTLLYVAEGLAKLGVRFDAVAMGEYKTGPDPLTRSSPRPQEREMTSAIVAQLYRAFVAAVARDRRLDAARIESVLGRAILTPAEALQLGLVDELTQPTDAAALPVQRERGRAMGGIEPAPSTRWGPAPVIAVLPIVGNITTDGATSVFPGGSAPAGRIIQQIEWARTTADVRAVVLRIDSPGGEVYASELIWRAVRLLAETKPVVVSMGEVAASGGYYIATPAHVILAQPSTITGSIGIFMLKPDLSGLLQLTGVRAEILREGAHASWTSLWTPLDERERARVRESLAAQYATFLDRVAIGRKLPRERVAALAEGRLYTGEQAAAVGLIDGVGGLADAVREAKSRADLTDAAAVDVRVLREPLSLGSFVSTLAVVPGPGGGRPDLSAAAGEVLHKLRALALRPLARMPVEVVVGP